ANALERRAHESSTAEKQNHRWLDPQSVAGGGVVCSEPVDGLFESLSKRCRARQSKTSHALNAVCADVLPFRFGRVPAQLPVEPDDRLEALGQVANACLRARCEIDRPRRVIVLEKE